MGAIVIKAMCIFRNGPPEQLLPGKTWTGEKLLFSRGYDTVKKQAFLRPLGGHVEFGETGKETIRREMQEEVGCDVLNVKFLSVIENIFTYNGKQSHEIIFMYEGKLADESFYKKEQFTFKEGNREAEAVWYSKADVEKGRLPIYPPFSYF